jgi:hypothetical protein
MGFGVVSEVNTMLDEFDDLSLPACAPGAPRSRGDAIARHRHAAARLVSRVYRGASASLRADMLSCLLRPLGTLGLAAVASGAFAGLLQRGGAVPDSVSLDDVSRYSSDQIRELALFVHEVDPAAIQHIGNLLSHHPMTVTALSASALVLMYRRWRPASRADRAAASERPAGSVGGPLGS